MDKYDFSLSIFSCRESNAVLVKTLNRAISAAALSNGKVIINILINGNSLLFKYIRDYIKAKLVSKLKLIPNVKLVLYSFSYGDKANTWNQYFYLVKPLAKLHIFIDGYVYIKNETFDVIDNAYKKNTFLAASGVPSVGRGAKSLKAQMISKGGMHGNLCVLSNECIVKLTDKCFALPTNLYRVDGLVGAVVNFNFSPRSNSWDNFGVRVIPELTWDMDEKPLVSLEILSSQWKRKLRQEQGNLENKAISKLFNKEKIEIGQLPASAYELLYNYLVDEASACYSIVTNPIVFLARRKVFKEYSLYSKPVKGSLEEREVVIF